MGQGGCTKVIMIEIPPPTECFKMWSFLLWQTYHIGCLSHLIGLKDPIPVLSGTNNCFL